MNGLFSVLLMWSLVTVPLVICPGSIAAEHALEPDLSLPLCGRFEHNEGRWLETPRQAARRQPPPCCGWDVYKWGGEKHSRYMYLDDVEVCGYEKQPLLTDPEVSGEEDTAYAGGTDYLVQLGGYGCSCEQFGFNDRFSWIPEKCRLLQWDARHFCDLLGQRRLLVVGDSTVSQAASVLMNYIHWDFWDSSSPGCQQQVVFANSDTLVGRNLGVDNRGGDWKRLVRHFDPDIILISSGPHVNRPMPLRDEDFESVIQQVAKEHRALFPEKKLIWKTQAPGGCTQNLSHTFPTSDFYRSLPYAHFNWEQFEKWDWMATQTFQGINQSVLDLSPLYYRTDAHPGSFYYEGYREDRADSRPMRPTSTNPPSIGAGGEEGGEREGENGGYSEKRDCLHHCVPGPIGLLPQLLLHLFYVEGL